jgi:ABC-type branched-subunit amino acid transport system ATPase component/ABC-type branched-subunit amino acid transport system permease subunit
MPAATIAVLGLVAAFLPGGEEYEYSLALVLIWAAVGSSWNIISGYGGQMAFGHAVFFGIGAFVSTLLMVRWHVSPLVGVWPGMLAAAAASFIIGWPTFKLSGVYFSLATLAYPLMFIPVMSYLGYQEVSVPYIRVGGAWFLQFEDTSTFVYVALAFLVVCVLVVTAIEQSRFGLSLLAIRDDQWAAEAAGINAHRTKLAAFAVSAALAAAAGTLYACLLLVITPQSVFGLTVTVKALMVALVGGLATVWGPIIGALLLIPLGQLVLLHFGSDYPGIDNVVIGIFLIVVTILAPEGLYWKLRPAFIRASTPAVSAVLAPIAPCPLGAKVPHPGAPLLVVEHLRKSYNGIAAVDDISFSVAEGEILGIIGPNGAGKTTLMNLLNGFVQPDAGTVVFAGRSCTGNEPWQMARLRMARTFQVPRLLARRSTAENVEIGAYHCTSRLGDARDQAAAMLRRVGLAGKAASPVVDLSTAEIRKLELARALVGTPRIILLDEPLAGLVAGDIHEFNAVVRTLRDEGLTIVIIEHTMSAMVELVDRFIVLDHGALLAEGVPNVVMKNPLVIEAYLGRGWANA